MRILFALLFLTLSVGSASAATTSGCVVICNDTCVTTEMSVFAKFKCNPKVTDECYRSYGVCERANHTARSCGWRTTPALQKCLEEKALPRGDGSFTLPGSQPAQAAPAAPMPPTVAQPPQPTVQLPTPVPMPNPNPVPPSAVPQNLECVIAGCSKQLCLNKAEAGNIMSTCEWRDSYACFQKLGHCEVVQGPGGQPACGWRPTSALLACLKETGWQAGGGTNTMQGVGGMIGDAIKRNIQ